MLFVVCFVDSVVRCSMMLINSLLSHANDARWEEFIAELERLNVRRAVIVSKCLLIQLNAILIATF